MSNESTYKGSCFCGAVQFTVTGEPTVMGYCHCGDCRLWSAGPVTAFTLWKPEALKVTRGAEYIGTYSKTPRSARKWCTTCGGHLFTDHPKGNLVDIYSATIPSFPFKPRVHLHYQEAVVHIHDGLRKLKDVSKAAGGSGETLPE